MSDSKGTYEIFSRDLDELARARNPETGRSDVTIIFPTLPDSSSELASIEVSSTATAAGAQRSVGGAITREHKVKAVDLRKKSKVVEVPEALAAVDSSTPQTLSKTSALAIASANDFGLSAAEQRLVDNITPPTNKNPCSVILLKDLGKRTTRIGQVWPSNSRAKVAFTYTPNASRGVTLGVGAIHKNGSSSASKSVVKNFSSTTPYTQVTGAVSKGYNKNTTYHKKYYYCVSLISFREVKIEPVGLSGSSVVTLKQSDAPKPAAAKCDWYYNGALVVDRGTNTQFTNGVSLKAVIGIDLAAQSGYHSGTKVAVNSTSGGLTICGSFGLPEAASTGDIVIK